MRQAGVSGSWTVSSCSQAWMKRLSGMPRGSFDYPAALRYSSAMSASKEPRLLSSGNPQIAKGDGDAPVKAYIAAMPGWKSEVGRRVDCAVEHVFPDVRKAVRWNTPLYGKEDGWFLAMYCYKRYVQLTFMRGTSLTPVPPKASKVEGTCYFDIHEGDAWDEARVADWVEQAIKLPGVQL
jgi:hypothetical protein